MLIKPVLQESVLFVIITFFKVNGLCVNQMSSIDVMNNY